MMLKARFDGPLARLQATLGWLALALVLLSVLPRGGDLPIAWTLLAFGVTGLFGLHVVLSVFRPAAGAVSRAVWPALLFGGAVTWGLLQVLVPVPGALAHPVWAVAPPDAVGRIGADPGQGAHIVMRLASYAMIAWLFVASALNEVRAWAYLKAIAIFSALIAVYALWAMAGASNPLSGVVRFGPDYTTGPFVSRNAYACYAAFGLFANIAVYLHLSGRGPGAGGNRHAALRAWLETFIRGAWIYLVGAGLCGAALVLTQSRAGVTAALIGLIVFAGCMLRRQRRAQAAVWLALLGLLAYVGVTYGAGTLDRLMAFESGGGRFEIYTRMLPVIAERPLLGHGAGAFPETFRAHVPLALGNDSWAYAHNSYLENAYEFGLPAAAAMYLALALVTLQIALGLRQPAPGAEQESAEADLDDGQDDALPDRDPIVPAMALAVLATAAAHSVIDYPLQLPGAAALFAVLIGIGWAQSFPRDDRRSLLRSEMTNDI